MIALRLNRAIRKIHSLKRKKRRVETTVERQKQHHLSVVGGALLFILCHRWLPGPEEPSLEIRRHDISFHTKTYIQKENKDSPETERGTSPPHPYILMEDLPLLPSARNRFITNTDEGDSLSRTSLQ